MGICKIITVAPVPFIILFNFISLNSSFKNFLDDLCMDSLLLSNSFSIISLSSIFEKNKHQIIE